MKSSEFKKRVLDHVAAILDTNEELVRAREDIRDMIEVKTDERDPTRMHVTFHVPAWWFGSPVVAQIV